MSERLPTLQAQAKDHPLLKSGPNKIRFFKSQKYPFSCESYWLLNTSLWPTPLISSDSLIRLSRPPGLPPPA